MKNYNRNYGLDTLRSIAIILVFMAHYTWLTDQTLFGPLGHMGGVGVDLFFALSGYLIGNQIFSALKSHENFSLPIFYARRLLRTLPNYFFVLGIYFLLPIFREKPLITPLWKFITFTQNFGLSSSAFSHAWSLCIEEQFYLLLPLIALFLIYKISARQRWLIILITLIGEIIIRGIIWFIYLRYPSSNAGEIYTSMIYYPTFCRIDSLVLGVSLALLHNYHQALWIKLTKNGNFFLSMGFIGYCFVTYIYQTGLPNKFFAVAVNNSVLALSSAALVISALCKNSLLSKVNIPGAMLLATTSYAIYLTHKPIIHVTQIILGHWHLENSDFIMLISSMFLSGIGGALVYIGIEKPFLKLRDKIGTNNATIKSVNKSNLEAQQLS